MTALAAILIAFSALLPTSGYEVLGDGALRSETTIGMVSACVHELPTDDIPVCVEAALEW